jgi:ankyrin repeat protein
MHGKLAGVCCQRNADPDKQRKEIEALLKAGEDIHATDKNGVTPLHIAVRFRSSAAVQTLLRHGARVNQACKRTGSTALHRAVTSTGAPETAGKQEEAKQIIAILLRFRADPRVKNKNGKIPMDYVRDDEIRRLLKRRPADDPRNQGK